jgi:hypothetical protein
MNASALKSNKKYLSLRAERSGATPSHNKTEDYAA